MTSSTGALIIVSGPSGAGKSTLLNRLMVDYPQFVFAVSCTTRKPRSGELDAREYYFIELSDFKNRITKGDFVEWEALHGNHYGTLKGEIARLRKAGHHVLLDLDVKGALNLRRSYPEAFLLFIAPPSREVLEQRLRARGTESDEQVAIRLDRCDSEMQASTEFDAEVVNDRLDESYESLLATLAEFLD